jgi:putative acetyltransferase
MISLVGLETADGSTGTVPSLSPLAVDPAEHGRGIGSALVRAVTAAAQRRGEALVVLEGDPRYYGRFGFEPAATHGIRIDLPSWAPPEAAQVLVLQHDVALPAGRIVYPPAFDLVARD